MGGKRRAAEGQGQTDGDASGGASLKRQTHGLALHIPSVFAEARTSSEQEESASILVPVSMFVSMRCHPSAIAGRKEALEAAVGKAVADFGGQDFRLGQTRVGPSEDTLQRVLPLVLERVEAEAAAKCFQVCKAWRRELEARGVCGKTLQLCATLAEDGGVARLLHNAQRRLIASNGHVNAFLQKSLGWKGGLHEWVQAASQEPDASFLSDGAASTALVLGLPLVRWVGKPQGGIWGVYSLTGLGDVDAVALSGNGKRVVTGSGDGVVKIWDAATGAEVCTLAGRFKDLIALDFSPDGERVLCSAHDASVKICNAETGQEVCTLTEHQGLVCAVAISPDGKLIVTGLLDKGVKIWDATTGAQMQPVTGHLSDVWCVAFSADAKRVVSGSREGTVKIWDVATGAEVCTLTGHTDLVSSVDFSPDGKRVVSGSYDQLVKIWDVETGAEILSLGEHRGAGICLCTVDEEGYLGEDEYGEPFIHPLCPCSGHPNLVSKVQFTKDGTQVISGSDDGSVGRSDGAGGIIEGGFLKTVCVWDAASGRRERLFAGGGFALVEGAGHTGGRHVLTPRGDTLLIYEISKGQPHAEDGAPTAPVAYFKAPQRITSVRCHGAAICVGCWGGLVCVLSAPFLAA